MEALENTTAIGLTHCDPESLFGNIDLDQHMIAALCPSDITCVCISPSVTGLVSYIIYTEVTPVLIGGRSHFSWGTPPCWTNAPVGIWLDGGPKWSPNVACLTHWGRVTHICVSKLTVIGSDNGLSPGRRQAIIWTNAGILLIGALGTNVNDILFKICTFSLKKMLLKMSSGKKRPSCLGLNVLTH